MNYFNILHLFVGGLICLFSIIAIKHTKQMFGFVKKWFFLKKNPIEQVQSKGIQKKNPEQYDKKIFQKDQQKKFKFQCMVTNQTDPSKILNNKKRQLKNHHKNIGKLLSYFTLDQENQKPQQGTAIMIGKGILLTVAHNICNQNNDQAKQIYFYPIQPNNKGRRIRLKVKDFRKSKQYKYCPDKFYGPNAHDIALLELDLQDLKKYSEFIPKDYDRIHFDFQLSKNIIDVQAAGFPKQLNDRIDDCQLYQQTQKSYDQDGRYIYYRHKTSPGQSGMPLFQKVNQKTFNLIGIHKGTMRVTQFDANNKEIKAFKTFGIVLNTKQIKQQISLLAEEMRVEDRIKFNYIKSDKKILEMKEKQLEMKEKKLEMMGKQLNQLKQKLSAPDARPKQKQKSNKNLIPLQQADDYINNSTQIQNIKKQQKKNENNVKIKSTQIKQKQIKKNFEMMGKQLNELKEKPSVPDARPKQKQKSIKNSIPLQQADDSTQIQSIKKQQKRNENSVKNQPTQIKQKQIKKKSNDSNDQKNANNANKNNLNKDIQRDKQNSNRSYDSTKVNKLIDKKNFKQAVKLAKEAVQKQIPAAYGDLARILLQCNEKSVIKKDDQKLKELALKGAALGQANSQYILGKCYFYGKVQVIQENQKEGVYYFKLSASQDNSYSQYQLGKCYFEGYVEKQNKQEGFKWFMKSAKQGHSQAQYTLAECYLNGDGVEVDKEKVHYWLSMSRQHGYPIQAIKKLINK